MLYIRISETCKKRFNISNENILERERGRGGFRRFQEVSKLIIFMKKIDEYNFWKKEYF